MNENEHEKIENESWDKELPDKTGLGTLLREHREKKGLDITQVSELTRLRPNYLEALEREDWDSLPAPVFVTGFIRSYARAINVDEEQAVTLYQKTLPEEPGIPLPLYQPDKRKKIYFVFPILAIILLFVAYYFWKTSYPTQSGFERPEVTTSVGKRSSQADVQEAAAEKPESEPSVKSEQEPEKSEEGPGAPIEHVPDEPTEEKRKGSPPLNRETVVAGTEAEGRSYSPALADMTAETETEGMEKLVLRADITERSWIRIFVDDQEPKEYIFLPGTHAEWKAKEGFELLIGNAGGVALQFEDEKIEDLGDTGRVVRLRFPKGYKRRTIEE